jgi:hypothetical protein
MAADPMSIVRSATMSTFQAGLQRLGRDFWLAADEFSRRDWMPAVWIRGKHDRAPSACRNLYGGIFPFYGIFWSGARQYYRIVDRDLADWVLPLHVGDGALRGGPSSLSSKRSFDRNGLFHGHGACRRDLRSACCRPAHRQWLVSGGLLHCASRACVGRGRRSLLDWGIRRDPAIVGGGGLVRTILQGAGFAWQLITDDLRPLARSCKPVKRLVRS